MQNELFSLQWLVGDSLKLVTYEEESRNWLFTFVSGSSLAVECLWRLKESESLVATSEDHGQQFGLSVPFDAAAALMERISNQRVSTIHVGSGTPDLHLLFGSGVVLEVLPTSAGYECWHAATASGELVHAMGSGELVASSL